MSLMTHAFIHSPSVNDTLDDILNESGDEEESDAIVSQVLDEIGIDISSRVRGAPAPSGESLAAEKSTAMSDEELMASLARLRST